MDMPDVMIVGAGPTGLTLGCGLLLHGVRVRMVDAAAGPVRTSRANFLHARGSEVLDRLGALGDLPERSISALSITVRMGDQTLSTMRFGDPGLRTAAPALLASQEVVEGVLRERFEALGGTVEWDAGAVGLRQDADGVTTELHDGRTARARWLVGCDGAHSIVRKQAGIAFPGEPVADTWLLADVHATGMPPRTGTTGWMHRDGLLGVMPLREVAGQVDDDIWRIMIYTPGTDATLDQGQILDRVRTILPERTGMTSVTIRDALWASVFRVHRRLVDHYRVGRVLLAGDAAHLHSPMGGQGMLTGIGDAENLAWKLALVTEGRAGTALLDTYEAERRPLAVTVLRTTSANTRIQTADGPVARWFREHVMIPVLRMPAMQRWGTMVASQLGVSYRRGPLGAGAWRARFGNRPRQGDRVPDLACRRDDGTVTRLHRELGGRWAVLAGHDALPALVVAACERLGDRVVGLTLAGDGDASVAPGRQGTDAMLVRPDGHLAWRGAPTAASMAAWLDTVLLGRDQMPRVTPEVASGRPRTR